MIAPVREIRNIFTSSTNTNPTQNYCLPTMYQDNNTGMDILKEKSPNNYNEVRDRLVSCNPSISRDTSISSTKSSITYHERMEQNNSMDVDDPPTRTPPLSYLMRQLKRKLFVLVRQLRTR